MDNIDLVNAALAALDNLSQWGKRDSKLWSYGDTIWSYETALVFRIAESVPNEYFINVTKYTRVTTLLQNEITRRFNPNRDPNRIVHLIEDMPPRCHGVDLARTYYELPTENRSRNNWKMPGDWPQAKDGAALVAYYGKRGHSLTTFQGMPYGIYTDCCNCGAYLKARVLRYNGETRYMPFESRLNTACEFPERINHD